MCVVYFERLVFENQSECTQCNFKRSVSSCVLLVLEFDHVEVEHSLYLPVCPRLLGDATLILVNVI